MKFSFEKSNTVDNEEIYRVNNFNCMYETDLFEDESQNLKNLNNLFENKINKFILHLDEFKRETIEKEMRKKYIDYKLFNFGRKNLFMIIDSIVIEQIPYIINLFYNISVDNTMAIICLGEGITVEFEKIERNKIIEYLFGECWIPECTLVPSSACAFIRYDGALLTIVGNNFSIDK